MERGTVDLRVGRVERIFAVLGTRLVVDTELIPDPALNDPDLIGEEQVGDALASFVRTSVVLWRRLEGVPHAVAGRLGALAQGLPVRPVRVDLRIAESDVRQATIALNKLTMERWHDRLQEFLGHDPDLTYRGPMRWIAAGVVELRIQIVPSVSTALTATVEEFELPLVPLAEIMTTDADVADLQRRSAITRAAVDREAAREAAARARQA